MDTLKPLLCFALLAATVNAADYPIVFCRSPRDANATKHPSLPEVTHPWTLERGTQICRLDPDGSVTVLVDAGDGAAAYPWISFDGKSLLYALFPDLDGKSLAYINPKLPKGGSDIWRLDLQTGEKTKLTHGETQPVGGAAPSLMGKFNLSPITIHGGRIVFASSRNQYHPLYPSFHVPSFQLFVMEPDGSNVEEITPWELGSAIDPWPLADGRIAYSTHQMQGALDQRVWGIWATKPDGTGWGPLLSAYGFPLAPHFLTQTANGQIVVDEYYNKNTAGSGRLLAFPVSPPDIGRPVFGPPDPKENDVVEGSHKTQYAFQPQGLINLTRFAASWDRPSPPVDGKHVGKVGWPSAAPGGDILATWTGPYPVAVYNEAAIDVGIYCLKNGFAVDHPSEMKKVIDDPRWHEFAPRALVPWKAIYGVDQPAYASYTPSPKQPEHITKSLPKGTPFGIFGSASTLKNDLSVVLGRYDEKEVYGVRLWALEGTGYRGARGFVAGGNERTRLLGDVVVRNDAPIDPDGNPDTSWLAKVPADTAIRMDVIDRRGFVLSPGETWKTVRPGEARYDCGGCHGHNHHPTDFYETAAAMPDYQIADLVESTPWVQPDGTTTVENRLAVTPEYYSPERVNESVRHIWASKCGDCHGADAQGGLRLIGTATTKKAGNTYWSDWETTISTFNGDNRKSARQSPLIWRLLNERVDGYPDITADPNDDDFSPNVDCKAHERVTTAEIALIGLWIDAGYASRSEADAGRVIVDEVRPVVSIVRDGKDAIVGYWDANPEGIHVSGLDRIVSEEIDENRIRVLDVPDGAELSVMAVDTKGNRTEITRKLPAEGTTPDPDCEEEKAALQAKIAELEEQKVQLQGKLDRIESIVKE